MVRQNPIAIFMDVRARLDGLHETFHKLYFSSNLIEPDKENVKEMLRVGLFVALNCFDLYIRELVIQRMGSIFIGEKKAGKNFNNFSISNEALMNIIAAPTVETRREIYEADLEKSFSKYNFYNMQDLNKAFNYISNESFLDILAKNHQSELEKDKFKTYIKEKLEEIVIRRNRIAHHGDFIEGTLNVADIDWNYFHKVMLFVDGLVTPLIEHFKELDEKET